MYRGVPRIKNANKCCVHVFPMKEGMKMAYQCNRYGISLKRFPVISVSSSESANQFSESVDGTPFYTRNSVRSVVVRGLISLYKEQGRPNKCLKMLYILLANRFRALSKSEDFSDIVFMVFLAIMKGERPDLAVDSFRKLFIRNLYNLDLSKINLNHTVLSNTLMAYLSKTKGTTDHDLEDVEGILKFFKYGDMGMYREINEVVYKFGEDADPLLLARYINAYTRSFIQFSYIKGGFITCESSFLRLYLKNLFNLRDKIILQKDDMLEAKKYYERIVKEIVAI